MSQRSGRSWIGVFGLALAAAAAARAAEPSEALVRGRGEAFVAAVNAPGRAALEAFVRGHLASSLASDGRMAAFVDRMLEETTQLGRIEQHSIQLLPSGRSMFVYCKRAKNGGWLNYQFRVLADDENRLQLIFRADALEPIAPTAAPLDSAEGRAWLAKFSESLERQQPFWGTVVVRRGGKELFGLAQGYADAAARVPNARSTRLGMASGSKMFTAVAILQLAQAGKLALGDPLSKYLKEFPRADFAAGVTLHQLLTHTAGAGDYWDDDYEKAWDSIVENRQMLPFVVKHLGDQPAGEFSYSNSGFILLGLVVEAASGQNYYDYVRDHIFVPAGMSATGYPKRSEAAKDLALPYNPEMDAGAVKIGSYLPVGLGARGTAAGGASTTVDDMLRFADALAAGKLIDKPHLELFRQPHVPDGGGQSYGYGTEVVKKDGVGSYGHGGSAPGTQFEFKVYPELDTVLVVMSNLNTIAGPEMASALDRLIRNGGATKR